MIERKTEISVSKDPLIVAFLSTTYGYMQNILPYTASVKVICRTRSFIIFKRYFF